MEHITDHTQSLDLNPRQIYIIVRKHNRKFLKTFESIAQKSAKDDIRFCVIDTTAFDEQPAQISDLYRQFLDEGTGNPWDFVVRDYPNSKHHFSFSCEHIWGQNESDIRHQLESLKEWQGRKIWDTITSFFLEKYERRSCSIMRIKDIRRMLNDIQRSKGCSDDVCEQNIIALNEALTYRESAEQVLSAVRAFFGDQAHIMDAFMHIKTPRDISDRYMLTFMETGGTISRPSLRIVKSLQTKKGIHTRFSLEIKTGTDEIFYPEFKMLAAFAFYILSMKEAGIHIRKTDFYPDSGSLYFKHYCMEFAAIIATIGENLYTHSGEALHKAEQECMEFHTKMLKDEKFWQNITFRCDEAIKKTMKEKGSPFLLHPLGTGNKPERWLEIPEDYIDLSDPDFSKAYGRNFAHIRNTGLFDYLDTEELKAVSALRKMSSAKETPIFTANKQSEKTEKMEKKTIICCGQYNFDAIWKRIFDANGKKLRDELHTEEIGGTAGNVACMTAYLGWHSYPLLQVGTYPQDLQTRKDFERYGCDTRFVLTNENANVTLYETFHHMDEQGHNLQHTKETVALWKEKKNKDVKEGSPIRTFSKTHAPFSGFPRVRTLNVKEEAPAFVEKLDFVPDVFFFDDPAAGWRYLAEALHQKGTLVYFEAELNGKNLKELLPCMMLADIVKFSDEHDEDYSFVEKMKDKLIIQTLGSKGIRFNLRGQGWQTLDPVVNEHVVDTEGCGDWTSSTFLTGLMKRDCLKLDQITEQVVRESLKEAQQMASLNVSYIGSKGLIYDDKEFGLAKSDYVDPYRPLMALKPLPYKHIKKLDDIPAKDYREYDDAESFVYNSGHERMHGEDWYFGKQAKDLLKEPGKALPAGVHADPKTTCSVMSNFYPCVLEFDGKTFNSAEQMYHYYRYQEYPLVQDVIMRQKKGSDVKSACQDFKRYDSNHNDVRWKYMTLCIELKYLQCKTFRDKLIATDGLYLVESTPGFDIHGSTIPGSHETRGGTFRGHDVSTKYIGMNGCGRCMMAVRDKFRGWTEAQLKAYTPSTDLAEWWNSSPTYLEQLEGMGRND